MWRPRGRLRVMVNEPMFAAKAEYLEEAMVRSAWEDNQGTLMAHVVPKD